VQTIRTPEGLELHFTTAAASERFVALCIDLVVLLAALVIFGIVLGLMGGIGAVLLLGFLLRQGYFAWFETRWNGSTPGKRRFHLRVIRADGGPLSAEILLARNLTREVELFLPLTVLFVPDALFGGHSGLVRVIASLWVLLLMFFPLTNRYRLRIGDLLAGTRVVVQPPVALLRDLADLRPATGVPVPEAAFLFTAAQLGIYGVHELQVLEEVLHKARSHGGDATLAAVTASICRRIGWQDVPARAEHAKFLRAFYTAQRQHLEQQLLLGRRRQRQEKRPK
jgi:uncharacterized RDD family membrane protein YckC